MNTDPHRQVRTDQTLAWTHEALDANDLQILHPNIAAPSPPLSSDTFSFSTDLAGDGSDALMAAMTTWGDFDSLVGIAMQCILEHHIDMILGLGGI